MSESFERFWFSRDCDGYTPDIVLSSIINLLTKKYSEQKFTFAYSPKELKKRLVKYFYLSYKKISLIQINVSDRIPFSSYHTDKD